VFLSATLGVRETLSAHVNLFFWELKAQQLRVFGLVAASAFLLAFFLVAPLHRRFDKRNTIMGSLVLVVIGVSAPLSLRLLGLFPPNGSTKLLLTLLGFYLVVATGFAILQISVLSVLADIADEHELDTGKRQEGMFYAARAFFGQVSSGLGHLLAGIALDVIAFPTKALPGTIPQEKLLQLAWVDGPIGAIPTLLAVFFYAKFRIDKKRHAEIQAELARRRRPPEPPSAAAQPLPSTAGEALSSG
jgi:Na+/melibiose symporter-like transporter